MTIEVIKLCTWEDCTAKSKHDLISDSGAVWANLCDEHYIRMDKAVTSLSPKETLGAWIKAQGGSKAAVKKMMD